LEFIGFGVGCGFGVGWGFGGSFSTSLFFCFYLNKIWTELQDNSIGTILLLVAMGCAMHSAVLV